VSAPGYQSKPSAAVIVALSSLSGTITIEPNTNVIVNTELAATYNGPETVSFSYQWKQGNANVGTDSRTYMPTVAGSYTVTVSAPGYHSKPSAAVNVVADIHSHDFNTQWSLLGFSEKPEDVTTAMDLRWNVAQIGDDDGAKFYPISTASTGNISDLEVTVGGETDLPFVGIYQKAPEMIFLLKGQDLYVWGRYDMGFINHLIRFDIAVIERDTGKGWLMQGANDEPYHTEEYSPDANGHTISFPISDLTDGYVTSASSFTGDIPIYNLYIIVRFTTLVGDTSDNNGVFLNRNVIMPTIR